MHRPLIIALLFGLANQAWADTLVIPGTEPLNEGWNYKHDGDVHRYMQGDNSMTFTLTCSPHQAATVELIAPDRDKFSKKHNLMFNIDGQPYTNPTNFSDPAIAQRFPWFLKALRNAQNVDVVFGSGSVTLRRINANLLPNPDSPDNPCNVGSGPQANEPSGPMTDHPQFKVSVPSFGDGYRPASVKSIVLTSLNDNVKIEQVVGNRGQCILAQYGQIDGLTAPKLPMYLTYGQVVAFPILSSSKNCNDVYEIEVITSNGNVVYTQKQN